jgi:hypothetical protein
MTYKIIAGPTQMRVERNFILKMSKKFDFYMKSMKTRYK